MYCDIGEMKFMLFLSICKFYTSDNWVIKKQQKTVKNAEKTVSGHAQKNDRVFCF